MFGKRKAFSAPDPWPETKDRLERAVAAIGETVNSLRAERDALEQDKQAMVHTIGALVLQFGGSVTIDPVYLAVVGTVESERNPDGSVTLRAR